MGLACMVLSAYGAEKFQLLGFALVGEQRYILCAGRGVRCARSGWRVRRGQAWVPALAWGS